MSHANEFRHSRPVRASTTQNGLEIATEDDWRRPIPKSGSDSRSTGAARPSSFGPNGGIRTMETLIGPFAVRDGTMLTATRGVYAVKT